MTARRRNAIAVVGLAAALSLAPSSWNAARFLHTASKMDGSEAQAVAAELRQRFRSPYVDRVVLVVQGLPSPERPAGRAALQSIVGRLRKHNGVAGTISYLDWPDPLFAGRNGGTFVVIGLASPSESIESLIPGIRADAEALRRELARDYPAVTLALTGETPLNFDLRKTSADDARTAEARILPLTLLLLVFAFRSVIAALLPLFTGVLTMTMTLGAAALIAPHWPLSILIQNLAAMLGLGMGIDYALLMVSRFREARRGGIESAEAADLALRQAGPTLLVSASTVAIGFAALLFVPISDLRSIGVAGFLVAAASVFVSLTILPAVLALLGPRLDRGRIALNETNREERWRRWGQRVTSHPWMAITLAGTPLLLLAAMGTRLSSALPRGDWLPPAAESANALRALEGMERAGLVESLRVVFDLPPQAGLTTDAGWNARASSRNVWGPIVAAAESSPPLRFSAAGASSFQ